jgi:hypothetical protein
VQLSTKTAQKPVQDRPNLIVAEETADSLTTSTLLAANRLFSPIVVNISPVSLTTFPFRPEPKLEAILPGCRSRFNQRNGSL